MSDPIQDLVDEVRARRRTTPDEARQIREASGVSLSRMARAINTNPSTLMRWERGEQSPRPPAHARWMLAIDGLRSIDEGPGPFTSRTLVQDALDGRVANALRRSGFASLGEVTAVSEDDLRKIRNFGDQSVAAVQEALARAGLALSPTPRKDPEFTGSPWLELARLAGSES